MNSRISFTPITKPSAVVPKPKVPAPAIQSESPSRNLLKVESANKTMAVASTKPIPKKLCGSLWHEGELCILVADTNVGKSIFAVQAGNNITTGKPQRFLGCEAEKQPILYFDFELSDKQFQRRYSCQSFSGSEMLYEFSDGFYRISIDPDFAEVFDFDTALMAEIERAVLETGAKILIIDNLTFLKTQAVDTAKEALPLMQKLKSLKTRLGLSMLVLAHTPKRSYMNPISKNDIAGSKHLANFADSIFAIGESSQDKSIRYIKQLKARETEIEYDSENVIECVIKKDYNFLHFDLTGFGRERNHLKQFEPEELEQQILSLREANPDISLRELAEMARTNHMKVKRVLDRNDPNHDNPL
jgi:RecA-family ATPase